MQHTETLITKTCGTCGTPYAISETLLQNLIDMNGEIFCPRGCRRVFTGSTAEQKRVKAEETAAREKRWRLEAEDKARKERFRCPSCGKAWAKAATLQKHMRTVHKAPLVLVADAGPDALNSKVSG